MKQSTDIFPPQSYPDNILIRFIWKVEKSGCGIEKERILPKGTAEIIFNLTEKTYCFKDSEHSGFDLPKCMINGLNTAPYNLVKYESQTFIGIQLRPYALKYLFGIPANEFTDQVFNGFDVCDTLKILYGELSSEPSFGRQVDAIINWFRRKVSFHEKHSARCLLFDFYNNTDIEDLSAKTISRTYGISDRHLRRLASDYLGMNTEDFILYRKYLRSLFNLHNAGTSLTSVAYQSGFYDQAHFIREFRAFTGLTPGGYRKQMSDLPGHLFF